MGSSLPEDQTLNQFCHELPFNVTSIECEDKIIITDGNNNDEKHKIIVMEEEDSLLDVINTSNNKQVSQNQPLLNSPKKKQSISFYDFRCICGETFFEDSSELLQCSNCAIFQHARCVGEKMKSYPFLCFQCIRNIEPSEPIVKLSNNSNTSINIDTDPLILGASEPILDTGTRISELVISQPSSSPSNIALSTPPSNTNSSSFLMSTNSTSLIRHSLPVLLPAIKSNPGSRPLAPILPSTTSLPMMMTMTQSSFNNNAIIPSLIDSFVVNKQQIQTSAKVKIKSQISPSSSRELIISPPAKRGRKPKLVITSTISNTNHSSSLVPALISNETLPPSFIEPEKIISPTSTVAITTTSNTYIPANHLRVSQDARNVINVAWKKFYESAISKRNNSNSYQLTLPAALAHSNTLIHTGAYNNYYDMMDEDKCLFKLLSKEFSLNCYYWPFYGGESPRRPLRLFTREFKSPSGQKSLGVFLTDESVDSTFSTVIMPGAFVTMLTGTLLTHSSLFDEFGVNCKCSNVPQYFLFFHPTLPIAVDTRKVGNMARFIRRSCRPNVALRGLFVSAPTTSSCFSNIEKIKKELDEEIVDLDDQNHPNYPSFRHCNYEDPSSPMNKMMPATFNIGIFATERIRPGVDELLLPLDKNEFYSSPCPGPHSGPGKSCLTPGYIASSIDSGKDSFSTIPHSPERGSLTICTTSISKDLGRKSPRSTPIRPSSSTKSKGNKKKTIPSPTTPVSPTGSSMMSREERKLQMYIESIQRLEQREKRKNQR